eukprot:1016268-Pleurochrysis_carterae.AAC.1
MGAVPTVIGMYRIAQWRHSKALRAANNTTDFSVGSAYLIARRAAHDDSRAAMRHSIQTTSSIQHTNYRRTPSIKTRKIHNFNMHQLLSQKNLTCSAAYPEASSHLAGKVSSRPRFSYACASRQRLAKDEEELRTKHHCSARKP